MSQSSFYIFLKVLTLLLGTIIAAESAPIVLDEYKATDATLLLRIKISYPLACWGISFTENSYHNILTSASATYGLLTDTPVFNKVHTPFFMAIKRNTRTENTLLFFGKISPPTLNTKSHYKYMSLKLDGFNKVFRKTEFKFKFAYCPAQKDDALYYNEILKNIKISDQDTHLLPDKNMKDLKINFSFDEDDINKSTKNPLKPQESKLDPNTIKQPENSETGNNNTPQNESDKTASEQVLNQRIGKENEKGYSLYLVYILVSLIALVIFALVLKSYRVAQNKYGLESLKEEKIENIYK